MDYVITYDSWPHQARSMHPFSAHHDAVTRAYEHSLEANMEPYLSPSTATDEYFLYKETIACDVSAIVGYRVR